MSLTLHIKDLSKPEVQAFLEYARTLKFVRVEEEEIELTKDQEKAILKARTSYQKDGGIPHDEVISHFRSKYPSLFK
jgi:hypothetical protein